MQHLSNESFSQGIYLNTWPPKLFEPMDSLREWLAGFKFLDSASFGR